MTKGKSTSKKKKKNSKAKVINRIMLLVLLIFIALLCYINILPTYINVIIIIFVVLISLVLTFLTMNKRVKDNIRLKSLIATVFVILIFLFININIIKTLNFWSKISTTNEETTNYSVLVLSDSKIDNIKKLKNEKVGNYNDVNLSDDFKIEVSYENYSDIDKLYNALFENKVTAIILEDSLKELAVEANSEYGTKTKSIYTIKVKEKSSVVVKNVDVTGKPFNVYLSGIDTYGEITSKSRSDVNIVVSVNPLEHKMLLTAIPRDYYVNLHSKKGYRDKLTHAGIYGVDESIATIEDLLGIDINYYVKVNFTSVIDIVNILGGITVDSERSFTSVSGYYFKKGINNLDGERALAFVRERYAFQDGDRQRGRNQETVIKALIAKATSPSMLLKYDSLLSKMSNKIETNIPQKELLSLVKMQLSNNQAWDIKTNNLDGANALQYTYTYPHQKLYVMIPNDKNLEEAKENMKEILGEQNG